MRTPEQDEALIRRQLKLLSDAEVLSAYQMWADHCKAMRQPNNYLYVEESYAYAKLRRDDHREEARRRNLI